MHCRECTLIFLSHPCTNLLMNIGSWFWNNSGSFTSDTDGTDAIHRTQGSSKQFGRFFRNYRLETFTDYGSYYTLRHKNAHILYLVRMFMSTLNTCNVSSPIGTWAVTHEEWSTHSMRFAVAANSAHTHTLKRMVGRRQHNTPHTHASRSESR